MSGAPKRVKTFYDVLNVSRLAKPKEIKAAYLQLAKKYHPDVNPEGDKDGEFKAIQEAYATLGNQWKKTIYDQDLHFGETAADKGVTPEAWKEAWEQETDEAKAARRERYKRYVKGERNDLPPPDISARALFIYVFGGLTGVYGLCIMAPTWIGDEGEPTFVDPAVDDKSVPLLRAFHNPLTQKWERLPAAYEPPDPKELYEYIEKRHPDLLEDVDMLLLPQRSLTVLDVPRTSTVRPTLLRDPETGITYSVSDLIKEAALEI